MTREEKLKLLLDTGKYEFIKSIPKENMWKLIFALAYIEDTIPMSDVDKEVKRMSNLEKAKEIVKRNYMYARCGIFDSRNLLGDEMCTIYKDESLTIDICYAYSYFEVFGLSDSEFEELEEYYYSLKESEV